MKRLACPRNGLVCPTFLDISVGNGDVGQPGCQAVAENSALKKRGHIANWRDEMKLVYVRSSHSSLISPCRRVFTPMERRIAE